MPLYLYIKLGPYKFSLQATVDHHVYTMNSGPYTALINCCGKHFSVTIIELLDVISRIPMIHLLPIYFCTNSWNVRAAICLKGRLSLLALSSVYSLTVEDGSWSTPMVPAQLSVPLQQVEEWAPKPVRWTMCFLLTTSDLAWTLMIVCTSVYIYMYIYIYIYTSSCVFGSLMSDVACNYVSADGGRDDPWWPALPGHWLSYTGCWQYLLVMYWLLCLGCCLYLNHLPRMFLSTDFAFWITDLTCCHGPHLHAILRIISRGVSGLATDSPCGVWGRG